MGFGGRVIHFTRQMTENNKKNQLSATQGFLWAFRSDLLRQVKKQGQYCGHECHIYGRKLNTIFAIHY